MSGKKSKIKGKSAERELCDILTEIFGAKFIRNITSGAYMGGKNIERKEVLDEYRTQMVVGDVIPPENLSKMIIECKNHNDFSVSSVFFGKYAKLEKWIEQYEMFHDENRINLLFAKEKRKGWVAFIHSSYMKHLPENMEYMRICVRNSCYYVIPIAQFEKNREFFKTLFGK